MAVLPGLIIISCLFVFSVKLLVYNGGCCCELVDQLFSNSGSVYIGLKCSFGLYSLHLVHLVILYICTLAELNLDRDVTLLTDLGSFSLTITTTSYQQLCD